MATFPLNLPSPLLDGYEVDPVESNARTDMESGAARVRRRTSAKNDKVTLTWAFSDEEFKQFRAWYDTDINGGASWFDMYLHTGSSSPNVQARFSGAFKASLITSRLHWKVSASLEIR